MQDRWLPAVVLLKDRPRIIVYLPTIATGAEWVIQIRFTNRGLRVRPHDYVLLVAPVRIDSFLIFTGTFVSLDHQVWLQHL